MNPRGWKIGLTALALAGCTASVAYGQAVTQAPSSTLIDGTVGRTTAAVNYRDRTSTKIDFQGTTLMPQSHGEAKVDARDGRVLIKAELRNLQQASSIGPAYLTYVLWAISPEGRPNNLGEVFLDPEGNAKVEVTTKLQTFALIVTAEPDYAVTFPSEVVVMENLVRPDTRGVVSAVNAKYDLLQRGVYDSLQLPAYSPADHVELSLLEARNAVRIAMAEGAQQYAPDSLSKAQSALAQAEDYELRHRHKEEAAAARDAAQDAEDARTLTVKRREDEQTAQRQQAAQDAAAQAQAAQQAEQQQRMEAERQRMQAEVAAANEAKARAEADAERQAALLREQQANAAAAQSAQQAAAATQQAAYANQQAADAQQEAATAQQQAAQAEQAQQELRAKLLAQFNQILETRDTVRGLIVNVGDVEFDTARYTLRPGAREALARFAGIVLAYPGLRLTIEGHTDNTGTPDFNQTLSEQRAASVRDYLAQQGLPVNAMTAVGMGEASPIADNASASGRQRNRRVEIVVSGEVIGTRIGTQP